MIAALSLSTSAQADLFNSLLTEKNTKEAFELLANFTADYVDSLDAPQVTNSTQSSSSFKYANQEPSNFSQSKKWLKKITKQYPPYAFYTDCKFNITKTKSGNLSVKTDTASCDVDKLGNVDRFKRGEAEHLSPASYHGYGLSCWKNGGRKNCRRTSDEFNIVEADPINLQYALGNVNADRSNYKFAEFPYNHQHHNYTGNRDIYFDDRRDLFEPPEKNKGWIGRVHLYMNDKYGVEYRGDYLAMMERWAQLPPNQWECDYNRLVKRDWGFDNKFTTAVCG